MPLPKRDDEIDDERTRTFTLSNKILRIGLGLEDFHLCVDARVIRCELGPEKYCPCRVSREGMKLRMAQRRKNNTSIPGQ
jgi:hypothetical protein